MMNKKLLKVIKIGGNDLSQPDFLPALASAVKQQQEGCEIILVHGGGKAVSEMMKALDIQPQFIDGQRVTDQPSLEVAEMILATRVTALTHHRVEAAGGQSWKLPQRLDDERQERIDHRGAMGTSRLGQSRL